MQIRVAELKEKPLHLSKSWYRTEYRSFNFKDVTVEDQGFFLARVQVLLFNRWHEK